VSYLCHEFKYNSPVAFPAFRMLLSYNIYMPHKSDEEIHKNNIDPKKSHPSASIKPNTERTAQPLSSKSGNSMDKFNAALRKILSVPKKNIK
jgi:hypothetical protein